MARAATTGELANFRKENQGCEVFLGGNFLPSAIFKARVNQPAGFSSYDEIASIPYDGISLGAYTDIVVGMTLYVGTSEGDYDRGMCRIRKDATADTLYIGEESEITWADDLYLTVVDDFDLWPRHIKLDTDGITALMDYDVSYSDEHTDPDPVPVLGPDVVKYVQGVVEAGNEIDIDEFDGSDSWVLGGTITAYSWSCDGPGSILATDETTATPNFNVNAAGTYRVSCEVTASNGKTFTGYRYVFIYDDDNPPVTEFVIESSPSGDYEQGGFSFRVTLYDQAKRSEIRDRARVILFARDWYGADTETSIGPVAGRENIVCEGWVDGETIAWNPRYGSVTFDVKGPWWWINKMTGFPTGVEDTDFADNGGGAADRWTEFNDLTVDKGLWHFLHWRTTATVVMDMYLTGDTRQLAALEAPLGTLWQQLTVMAGAILAKPCTDQFMRLFVEIDTQFMSLADRSSIPTVMAITTQDWREQVDIERSTVDEVGLLEFAGTYYADGEVTASCAKAYGNVPGHYGNPDKLDRIALSSAAQAAELAGLVLDQRNNEYKHILIPMAANNRLIGICPRQYVTMSIAESDTERGIVWSTKNLIPRRITLNLNKPLNGSGYLLTDIECEAETTGTHGMIVACPEMPDFTPITFTPPNLIWPIITLPGIPEPTPTWQMRMGTLYFNERSNPPQHQKSLITDASGVAGTTANMFNSNNLRAPDILSDDEYIYYREYDNPNTVVRYKISDGSTTSLTDTSGKVNWLGKMCLFNKNVVLMGIWDTGTTPNTYGIMKFDFTTSLVTQQWTEQPDSGFELLSFHFMTTVEYDGTIYTVLSIELMDDVSFDYVRTELKFYNWTYLTLERTVEFDFGTGADSLPSYCDVFCSPIYMNGKLFVFYRPFVYYSTSDDGFSAFVAYYNFQTTYSTQYKYTNHEQGDDPQFYKATPNYDLERIYFYLVYPDSTESPYPANYYDSWGYFDISDGSFTILDTDMAGSDTVLHFVHSDSECWRLATTGEVFDIDGTLIKDIGSPPSGGFYPNQSRIANFIDETEKRLWYLNGANIEGHLLEPGSSDVTTITTSPSLSLGGNWFSLFLHGNIFIVDDRYASGTPRHKVYLVK